MEAKADEFVVTLFFNDNGELLDVQPAPGKKEEGYEYERVDNLRDKKIFSSTSLLYGHGSPGYTIYKTKSSYVIIKKPQ